MQRLHRAPQSFQCTCTECAHGRALSERYSVHARYEAPSGVHDPRIEWGTHYGRGTCTQRGPEVHVEHARATLPPCRPVISVHVFKKGRISERLRERSAKPMENTRRGRIVGIFEAISVHTRLKGHEFEVDVGWATFGS